LNAKDQPSLETTDSAARLRSIERTYQPV
jgi:hypothetical protein